MVVASRVKPMPWWTLGLLGVLLVAQWIPAVADALIYDRIAVTRGEAWRIVTGHLVHYSTSHLLANLAVLIPAAWLVETRHRGDVGVLLATAAVAIGGMLFVAEPGILQFGGASGIALAFLVYVGLCGLHGSPRWRVVCSVLLVGVMAKFFAELAGWQWRDWHQDGFVPVVSSHVVGAAAGGALYLWRIIGRGSFWRPAASFR